MLLLLLPRRSGVAGCTALMAYGLAGVLRAARGSRGAITTDEAVARRPQRTGKASPRGKHSALNFCLEYIIIERCM